MKSYRASLRSESDKVMMNQYCTTKKRNFIACAARMLRTDSVKHESSVSQRSSSSVTYEPLKKLNPTILRASAIVRNKHTIDIYIQPRKFDHNRSPHVHEKMHLSRFSMFCPNEQVTRLCKSTECSAAHLNK